MSREKALKNLNVKPGNRVILSVDGGGMRGIFTLQLLKKLEEVAGAPVYEWADMVAGTSTGAIITGLIACRKSAVEIEQLYIQLVSRVFTKRNRLSSRFYNAPAFDKKEYRALLKEIVGEYTLERLCIDHRMDMLFTAKDLAAGEETFFACVNNNGLIRNIYKDVLLRGVLEATMSAPTYFAPFERFADGGTTTFNNPVSAAVMEAIFYDGKGKYTPDALTVLSFGTATTFRFIDPKKTNNPKGLDSVFWLNYVMAEASKDASEMQVDALRRGMIPGLDFRRYQLSLDSTAVRKLPDLSIEHLEDMKVKWLHELTDEMLSDIDMADVSKFPLMKTIGEATALFVCPPFESGPLDQRPSNWFQRDLVIPGTTRGALITAHGNPAANRSHLSNGSWIDSQVTG
jgi:uncharacterized protein